VARLHRVDPALIVKPNRTRRVYYARLVVAKLLWRRGYSSPRIGGMLGHDHTTILFYVGKLAKKPTSPKPPRPKPPAKKRWGKPHIAHLKCKGCRYCIRPKQLRSKFLVPYAGADMRDYQWKPKAEEITT
jgi:hypothetical protein